MKTMFLLNICVVIIKKMIQIVGAMKIEIYCIKKKRQNGQENYY